MGNYIKITSFEKYLNEAFAVNERKALQKRTFKYIEENILEPIADNLGEELQYENKDKFEGKGKKVIRRFYSIGPTKIVVIDTKVAGVEQRDPEIILINPNDQSTGIKFNPMIGYDGLEEAVKKQYLDMTGKNDDEYENNELEEDFDGIDNDIVDDTEESDSNQRNLMSTIFLYDKYDDEIVSYKMSSVDANEISAILDKYNIKSTVVE